ncbi:MAG: pyridoxamine 5'-phosphate oxidase family protein [Evtepia gabavorous]
MTERPMRRKDRQFSAADARAILAKGTHGVLSVVGDGGWPYAVPMNYTVMGTQIYLHCARAGYKLDAIARDDRVCFTVVTQAQVIPAHITTLYESVVVLGRAQVVTAEEERLAALGSLIDTLGDVTPEIKAQYLAKKAKNTTLLRIQPCKSQGKPAGPTSRSPSGWRGQAGRHNFLWFSFPAPIAFSYTLRLSLIERTLSP